MKKKVTVTFDYEVEIEDSKIDEILKDYRESIKSNATIDDIFCQVAYSTAYGVCWAEGVGAEGKDYEVSILDCETEINN